jgi:hypothetical protein
MDEVQKTAFTDQKRYYTTLTCLVHKATAYNTVFLFRLMYIMSNFLNKMCTHFYEFHVLYNIVTLLRCFVLKEFIKFELCLH